VNVSVLDRPAAFSTWTSTLPAPGGDCATISVSVAGGKNTSEGNASDGAEATAGEFHLGAALTEPVGGLRKTTSATEGVYWNWPATVTPSGFVTSMSTWPVPGGT
jgi:hypothetical protein